MFSGIIQSQGTLVTKKRARIEVLASPKSDKLGDSIAINGVCLTLVRKKKRKNQSLLSFDLSKETLQKSCLGSLLPGQKVNLERALTLRDALGGHIVQGHVDGSGKIVRISKIKDDHRVWIKTSKSILTYMVPKGSVTLDGVSLTVVDVKKDGFSVTLVPYTLKHTTLKNWKVGQSINLEADVIAKYIAKYVKK